MPCDTARLPNQTLTERKREVLDSVVTLQARILAGLVKVKVGPQGAIVFEGWTDADRRRVTDACAYRRLMAIGGSLVKAKIAQAATLAGRPLNVQAIGQGAHSHDGGATWHTHKG
jgi:hypothetical protein